MLKLIRILGKKSTKCWWYFSITSAGDIPSSSAFTVMGVPWVSEPLMKTTSCPIFLIYLTKMSAGTYVLRWAMWQGPFT
ncbi:hypothetical protein ES703_34956 [subsurface metagenome]